MTKTIEIEQLSSISTVPSKALCMAFAEATSICLDYHQHPQKVNLQIKGGLSGKIKLSWKGATKNAFDSYDKHEATEMAAVCLALWIIEAFTEFRVVQRGRIGDRVDYILTDKDATAPFPLTAYLEISGLLNEKIGRVNQRLKEKIKQVAESNFTGMTGIVIVVEFSQLIAKNKVLS